MCRPWELNPHVRRRRSLKPLCMPVPPERREESQIVKDLLVPTAGLEPARPKAANFKSAVSTVPPRGRGKGIL